MGKDPIGGQAVIEGVMMRDKGKVCVAVRKPGEDISLKFEEVNSLSSRIPMLKAPVLRGIVAFFESLVLGIKTLTYSANEALDEDEEELTNFQLFLTIAFALTMGIGLFFFLPTFLMGFASNSIGVPFYINLGEGVVRVSIFLIYVLAISRIEDIQRVFQYHGAEHKVIHCHEANKELTPENAKDFSPLHPRCGTSFLLIVMMVSIILFSFFGWPNLLARFGIRLLILPIVAGLSYEVIRFAGRKNNFITRLISYPGLFLQKLTTREPDKQQLEVAIRALETIEEKKQT
ncbi:DUF1385 domain-containing protein [Natranaerofaba carboxydovora]|uniref:DUF1385 domain-containing protein n=1 Tax=Natranaerofaba carboxydovora TaxID=2742683 RepID=UPI001F1453FC|nr:DUF1385 domain-containing protein [Natranaerofaba carboxydovora]UMZ75129.1 hypothetical protein ACONDI_02741 [Natranaerofaba carboxydovora]